MTSLGILGGTFNPPHLGHRAVAVHAREALGLDRVLLMPALIPPHKLDAEDPGAKHRLCMCELLLEDARGLLRACDLELEREGPSYTVDTLRSLHASDPTVQLTFVVGADTASTLASWREPRELLGLARLAVAARAGSDRRQVLDTIQAVAGAGVSPAEAEQGAPAATVRFLDMQTIEISSSAVRERVARAQPIEELVGEPVAGYIAEHGLYRLPEREGGR